MNTLRNRYLLLLDSILLAAAPLLMYALRFESWTWGAQHRQTALYFDVTAVPLALFIFYQFGLYRRLWRYASVAELELIFLAGAVTSVCWLVLGMVILPFSGIAPVRVPASVVFSADLLLFAIAGTPRLLLRMSGLRAARRSRRRRSQDTRLVLVAGAGAAGQMVAKELRLNPDLGMEPLGFVDDDIQKQNMHVGALPVLGPLSAIPDVAKRTGATEVLIAMPRAPGSVVRQVVRSAESAGVRTRIIPGLFEILSERVNVSAMREVQIEDLLRREVVRTDLAGVKKLATGRVVMVTGAGGSIGSELCRQLSALEPSMLVLVGHGENPIFEISQQLAASGCCCRVETVIADIRNATRVRNIFERYQPHAVFHAAAHKHVPLMEANVVEAVTNNVIGTLNVVEAAVACNTPHLVMISTDKAVRPTNIMGATKRVAEHIVLNAAAKHGRNFVAVRFGNVLGSQGSVVPTFARQIRDGGPVTVTHPEMRRYFMTIPEAVHLVLQAGALGQGGELFMLDMGEPVKIVDLARDMIRLSGLEVGVDIDIEFTGTRPGEKLYEEMFFSHEVAEPTDHPKILRARNGHEGYCDESLIDCLIVAAKRDVADDDLRRALERVVPDLAEGSALSRRHQAETPERTLVTTQLPRHTPAPNRGRDGLRVSSA